MKKSLDNSIIQYPRKISHGKVPELPGTIYFGMIIRETW